MTDVILFFVLWVGVVGLILVVWPGRTESIHEEEREKDNGKL